MEGRRSTAKMRLRSSPGRSVEISPAKRKSPGRGKKTSPARKSPGRKSSPARKSPSRKTMPGRVGRPPASHIKDTSKAKEEKKTSPITVIDSKIEGTNALKTSSVHSVLTSFSSSSVISSKTTETINISSSRPENIITNNKLEDTSGDSEVAKLTSIASFVRRSLSKNLTPPASIHHLTPTPTTEQSQSRHSRSVSRSVFDDDENYSRTEYSDNENEERFQSFKADISANSLIKRNISRQVQSPREFGGAIGVILLLFVISALTSYLQWTCGKTKCDLKTVDFTSITRQRIEKIFDLEVVGVYIAFLLGITIISACPIGRTVQFFDERRTTYLFTSIPASLIVTLGFGIGEYLKYPIADYVLKNYLKFFVYGQISAVIVASWCYIRSKYKHPNLLNPYAKSGNFLIDFCIGREISPKWFDIIDIKLCFYRASLILTLIFAEVLIYKNIQIPKLPIQEEPLEYLATVNYFYENIKFDPTALIEAVLLLLYVSDLIIYEHHLSSSFELQQEGVGCLLLLRYAVTPFLLAAAPKYCFDYKPSNVNCLWAFGLMFALFAAGQTLKRKSNSLKYRYRMDPSRMELLFIDTVPTFQGRRLLLGKYWGTVRQPNYTGDIIALLAFTVPLYKRLAWPPLISVLIVVFYLIHRAIRVNARNSARYNSAWTRYCGKVPHLIVPKVF